MLLYKKNYCSIFIKKFIQKCSQSSKMSSTFCMESVKKYDYENFLSTLLLPMLARDSVFAIRAFNIEVAQVKDLAKKELFGRMRFQFWHDTIDNIYKQKATPNPVAKALLQANINHKLSKKWLKNMIESREERLVDKPFSSIEELESYSEKSNSSVYYLTAQCLGIKNLNVDHVASHIGKSEGIVKMIRGIPHHASRKQVYIPLTLMATHGLSQLEVTKGIREQKMKDVIYELASVANEHLEHAKSLEKDVPIEARSAFLIAIALSSYLRRLQLADFDIFDPKMRRKNILFPFKMYWGNLKKTYS